MTLPTGAPSAAGRYAYVLFPRDWTTLTAAISELAARYRRLKRPEAALIVERAWSAARAEQLALGREIAVLATDALRRSEKGTRVRPDTEGGGGPRLGDYLRADVMPHQDLLPGSVGVANEEELDAHVPWWTTNEIGSTTLIGRRIFGLFYGGDENAPPNMDQFREHPLFTPAPSAAGAGQGVIEHGIPARRFIRKALPEIDRAWHAGFDAIKARLVGELSRAAGTPR